MPYRSNKLSQLVQREPDTARERIRAAYLLMRGNAVHAAKWLDVSHRSLCRYVNALSLSADVQAIRENSKKVSPQAEA